MKRMNIRLALLAVLLSIAAGCESMFSYSVYEARVPENRTNTTAKNLALLEAMDTTTLSTYKIAVLADPHYHYDRLGAAVSKINLDPEIKFVIVNGDLADQGLLQEYMAFHDVMEKLDKPYFTVIGNHDYLSNAEDIYLEMFGPYNYSFNFNGSRFVLFDDVVWESNKTPDFSWLEHTLSNDSHGQAFVFAHIAPFGDQMRDVHDKRYNEAMQNGNVTLSVHGHGHSYYEGDHYNDGMRYLMVPWIEKGYCELIVHESGVQYNLIEP
ncbi:MAG TPA: metallophosphoesterase [Chitinophagales bacterium]|nr:metallophosphoesterase [Chitinophagales bacterium]